MWTTWWRYLKIGKTSMRWSGPCGKGGTFHTGVSDPGSHKETDNGEEEKHTQTKKQKAKESQTQADQQTWGRLCVYDPPLPPRPLLHTHTHMDTLRTTHCLADLFKSQELCLSFPTSCSQKYLWAKQWVFFCVLYAYAYTFYTRASVKSLESDTSSLCCFSLQMMWNDSFF